MCGDHQVKCDFGEIEFHTSEMPGCCGVSVIHDVDFYTIDNGNINDLYKYFHDVIIFGEDDIRGTGWNDAIDRGDDFWKVNKFLLTDQLYPKGVNSLYNFCHYIGAHYSTVTHNPNSGNQVQVFELTRPKKFYWGQNGECVPQTKGIQTPKVRKRVNLRTEGHVLHIYNPEYTLA